MRLVVSRDADDDLQQIACYLVERNPLAAASIFDDINRKFVNLTHFPFIGRDRSSLRPGIRSIVADPYVIFYRVDSERITILRILHGRRDIDAEFRR
jgi:toxin ParE1/3/4